MRLDLLVFFRLQSRLAAIRSLPLFVLGFVLMHGKKRTDSSIARQTLAPRMDVVSLQSMKRQVSDQVRYIQLELKKVTKHAKAAQKRTAQIYRVAIAILCMTDGADAAASSFLQIQCQHAVQENPTSLGTMVSEVIELYKHMSQEEKDALCAAVSGSPDFEANRKAKQHVREFKLADWIEDHNMARGIAPHTKNVARKAQFLGVISTEKQKKYKSQKQWLRRWRKMEHFNWQCARTRGALSR